MLKRLSAYGDLATRALQAAVRSVPWFLEPVFLFCYAIIYTIVSRPPLRALQRNIDTIFANSGRRPPLFAQFRTVYQFAATMAEGMRASHDPESLEWTVDGVENLEQMISEKGGVILLTIHMGSYDLAATSFVEKLGRNVNMVRTPERDEETQKLREIEIARASEHALNRNGSRAPRLNVHFNRDEGMLGIDLTRALHRNEFVAIQGDRVLCNVSGMTTPAFGSNLRIPKGPFVLAEATRAPIYPLFVIRKGWRHYAVRCLPPLPLPTASDRSQRLDDRAASWARELESLVAEHWNQWFVFEDAFTGNPQPAMPPATTP